MTPARFEHVVRPSHVRLEGQKGRLHGDADDGLGRKVEHDGARALRERPLDIFRSLKGSPDDRDPIDVATTEQRRTPVLIADEGGHIRPHREQCPDQM
jgi:hypothetical protein